MHRPRKRFVMLGELISGSALLAEYRCIEFRVTRCGHQWHLWIATRRHKKHKEGKQQPANPLENFFVLFVLSCSFTFHYSYSSRNLNLRS